MAILSKIQIIRRINKIRIMINPIKITMPDGQAHQIGEAKS